MFHNYYQNKKIFVTGHTGLKGSWMAYWLHQLGAQVKGFALAPNTPNDHFCQIKLDQLIESEIGDVRNKDQISQSIKKFSPDIIFHLAAQPLVRESYLTPVETFETNVNGTINVLEAARSLDHLQGIVNVTTDKCYRNQEKREGYAEHEPLGGHDPYSASKACSEIVTQSYEQSFFSHKKIMVATARAGNVIGGGDWSKDRIMTDVITSLNQQTPVKVRNPKAIRPWQHVLEPVSAYLQLGTKAQYQSKFSGAWNIGPYQNQLFTVQQVVEKAIECYQSGSWELIQSEQQLHETTVLTLKIEKALEHLGWKPSLQFDETIKYTTDWYKELQVSPGKMANVTLQQIQQYTQTAKDLGQEWTK